jgi:hypothetical protein
LLARLGFFSNPRDLHEREVLMSNKPKLPPPEEASGPSLAIIYQLPSDIAEKLSHDELRCFYSWSEA